MIDVGKIARDIIAEYPDLPSRTLARIMYARHPQVFSDLEAARTRIRYYRGKLGKIAREQILRKYGKEF